MDLDVPGDGQLCPCSFGANPHPLDTTDCVLLLAAHAHAEGDDDRARSLLLSMGLAQSCGTVAFARDFAVRLGIEDQYRAHEIDAMNPDSKTALGVLGSESAGATLRNELARRGWT